MPPYDPRYLAFFDHFNRQQYFEAHEVLEGLWLETHDHRRDFYKGLIQTAAVFLKLQQQKPAPAARLAGRARALLARYEPEFEGLDVRRVRDLLESETLPEPPPQLMPETPCA